jgi:hypothetical protein
MIDLDSVCSYDDWITLHQLKDQRYISQSSIHLSMESAIGYVLLQVVCIGESWLAKMRQQTVNVSAIIEKRCNEDNALVKLDVDTVLDD